MERIQEALAKARAARETGPVLQAAPAPDAPPPADTAQSGDWGALRPVTLDTKRLIKARVMTLAGGRDAAAFDVMRTKVLQTMRANKWRRLAITSPSPGCGKSTLALNLVFSVARQAELKAMLFELDLRRPSLAQTLGLEPSASVEDVLAGKVGFADQALCHNRNMALSLCKGSARNPAEILHSAFAAAKLAEIEAAYAPDLMVFDMPPMLVSDDMMAFAGQVDSVLLVAEAERTSIKEIDICERELSAQTNFMGVLLNKCRYMDQDYGYSYYG